MTWRRWRRRSEIPTFPWRPLPGGRRCWHRPTRSRAISTSPSTSPLVLLFPHCQDDGWGSPRWAQSYKRMQSPWSAICWCPATDASSSQPPTTNSAYYSRPSLGSLDLFLSRWIRLERNQPSVLYSHGDWIRRGYHRETNSLTKRTEKRVVRKDQVSDRVYWTWNKRIGSSDNGSFFYTSPWNEIQN